MLMITRAALMSTVTLIAAVGPTKAASTSIVQCIQQDGTVGQRQGFDLRNATTTAGKSIDFTLSGIPGLPFGVRDRPAEDRDQLRRTSSNIPPVGPATDSASTVSALIAGLGSGITTRNDVHASSDPLAASVLGLSTFDAAALQPTPDLTALELLGGGLVGIGIMGRRKA
jgi:hypothetical protein